MQTKIPYGYVIKNGVALPHPKQAKQVRDFFDGYVSGMSLKDACHASGMTLKWPSCRRLIDLPAYGGDGFYPAIVDAHTLEVARAEAKERGSRLVGKKGRQRKMPVPVRTWFVMEEKKEDAAGLGPAEYAAWLYGKIRQPGLSL